MGTRFRSGAHCSGRSVGRSVGRRRRTCRSSRSGGGEEETDRLAGRLTDGCLFRPQTCGEEEEEEEEEDGEHIENNYRVTRARRFCHELITTSPSVQPGAVLSNERLVSSPTILISYLCGNARKEQSMLGRINKMEVNRGKSSVEFKEIQLAVHLSYFTSFQL